MGSPCIRLPHKRPGGGRVRACFIGEGRELGRDEPFEHDDLRENMLTLLGEGGEVAGRARAVNLPREDGQRGDLAGNTIRDAQPRPERLRLIVGRPDRTQAEDRKGNHHRED